MTLGSHTDFLMVPMEGASSGTLFGFLAAPFLDFFSGSNQGFPHLEAQLLHTSTFNLTPVAAGRAELLVLRWDEGLCWGSGICGFMAHSAL